MKTSDSKRRNSESNDMLPEYDFTGGVRGKYYKAYRKGHTVKIHKTDGTTSVQHFRLIEGAVMLDSDVKKYFPDSDAVNKALRCLIPLMQSKRRLKQGKRLAVSK